VQTLRGVGVRLDALERSISYLRSQGDSLARSPRFRSDVEQLVSDIDPQTSVDLEPPEVSRLTPQPPAATFG
jgi:hypothetical protein